jgi:hypothetical protein
MLVETYNKEKRIKGYKKMKLNDTQKKLININTQINGLLRRTYPILSQGFGWTMPFARNL